MTSEAGKGERDRITMLPESVKGPFQDHLRRLNAIHDRDLAEGWGSVQLPIEQFDINGVVTFGLPLLPSVVQKQSDYLRRVTQTVYSKISRGPAAEDCPSRTRPLSPGVRKCHRLTKLPVSTQLCA